MYINKEFISLYEKDLIKIKVIMESYLHSREKKFDLLLKDLSTVEGKLLRPILVLLGTGFGSIDEKKRLHLATLIEMLHLATLVHDDVIDQSTLRRGNPTVQSKYGVKIALFMGDFLFSTSYILLSQYASSKNIEKVSKATRGLCRGEIQQLFSSHSLDCSVKNYLRRIKEKTASLFSLSLYLGASESNADPQIQKKLSQIGNYIGMAFQIIDDILDLTGNEKTLGKPAASDLKQGIYCLPIIYELRKNNAYLKGLLECKTSSTEVLQLLSKSEGLDMSRALAKQYTKKALLLIDTLPNCAEKDILHELTKMLLVRNY